MIQIPIPSAIKRKVEIKAQAMGYASVEDMLSKFIVKVSTNKLDSQDVVYLSKKAQERYAKMDEDYKNGKNWHEFDNADDALAFLINGER
jgi:hypothetical protein